MDRLHVSLLRQVWLWGTILLPFVSSAENPDILAGVAALEQGRPRLVVGFAAETQDVTRLASEKRARKGCDWIVANDVSPGTGTFAGDANTVHLITDDGVEDWPRMSKTDVADRLADRITEQLGAGE